jgi:hypothetical protein
MEPGWEARRKQPRPDPRDWNEILAGKHPGQRSVLESERSEKRFRGDCFPFG